MYMAEFSPEDKQDLLKALQKISAEFGTHHPKEQNVYSSTIGVNTKLIYAVKFNNLPTIVDLLRVGADPTEKGPNGLSAYDEAMARKREDVVELFNMAAEKDSDLSPKKF